jgi:hypothetical protein
MHGALNLSVVGLPIVLLVRQLYFSSRGTSSPLRRLHAFLVDILLQGFQLKGDGQGLFRGCLILKDDLRGGRVLPTGCYMDRWVDIWMREVDVHPPGESIPVSIKAKW